MDDEVVSRAESPGRFADLFERVPAQQLDDDPLYGDFGRQYYPAVFGHRLQDTSFAVVGRDDSVYLVECDVLEGVLGRFGMPLRIVRVGTNGGKAETRLLGLVLSELRRIAQDAKASRIAIADDASTATLGALGRACLGADGRASTAFHACVDLSHPDASLRSDVRSSYRSLLNWGQRSLSMSYCNASEANRARFGQYEELHEQVAGRRTRPQASWDVMYDFVAGGRGELTLASLDGDVVAGLLVFDGTATAHYASAAYVRERFEHPLAHWPLFDAILRAKARGLEWFDIGELRHRDDVTDKEASIGFFKRGFTNRIEARTVWDLPMGVETS
jgi:hypothetical protein